MAEKRADRKCGRRDFLRKVAAGGALASTIDAPALAGEGTAPGSGGSVGKSTPASGVGHWVTGIPQTTRRPRQRLVDRSLRSGDAYARFDASKTIWTLGTGLIEQQLELVDGHFRLARLRNLLTGSEYVEGAGSDEFHFSFGGREFSGDSGGYELVD